jgi:hypothetical protein
MKSVCELTNKRSSSTELEQSPVLQDFCFKLCEKAIQTAHPTRRGDGLAVS